MTPNVASEDALLASLEQDGALLLDAFARCDPDAVVPGLEWDVRTVVAHTAAVHRWAADIVGRQLATNETGGSAVFYPHDLADDELAHWFTAGHAALLDTLRDAPEQLACFTFLRGRPPRRFWIARQAHETAVHRADVEAAAGGPVTPFDAVFAQDGLAELVGGFATRRGFATERPGRLLLECSDGPSWLVTFGGERNQVEAGELADATADAAVRGTSSELYLWAWNRPTAITAAGDPGVIDSWRAVRIT